MKFNLALQKLNPSPEDVIVMTVREKLTEKDFLQLKNRLKSFLTSAKIDNRVLILEAGFAIDAKSIDKIKSDLDAIRV